MNPLDSQDTKAATSSHSLELNKTARLSGFFTPVWESRQRKAAFNNATPSSLENDPSSRTAPPLPPRMLEEATASERFVSAGLPSQLPESALASPAVQPRVPRHRAALLRRLRRTLRLYTPLPDDIAATLNKYRLR